MMKQFPAGRVPGTYAPSLPADELSLNELYFTIQGECRYQGLPTVFVRTSHCPLRCTWCFGPDTRILMGDWTWKRIADVLVGDVVMGRSERTKRLVRTIVTAKSVVERSTVVVNGTLVTTPDHKFLHGNRWRPVDRMVGSHAGFVAPPRPMELLAGHGGLRQVGVPILESQVVREEIIRDVASTGRIETVVDLSTTDRSFVAEGFVVHNCDSKYTFTEGSPWPLDKIVAEVAKHPTRHVCLTGGEPLAQPASLELLRRLAKAGYTIEVETSGSEDIAPLNRFPADLRERVVVNLDVKCPGSAMTNFNRWPNLAELRPHDQLKFILLDRADYEYAKKTLAEHRTPCEAFFHPVWSKLDPAKIAEWVKEDGLQVRVGVQLHKYLWGERRGV